MFSIAIKHKEKNPRQRKKKTKEEYGSIRWDAMAMLHAEIEEVSKNQQNRNGINRKPYKKRQNVW